VFPIINSSYAASKAKIRVRNSSKCRKNDEMSAANTIVLDSCHEVKELGDLNRLRHPKFLLEFDLFEGLYFS
jgi:hypothetical protein